MSVVVIGAGPAGMSAAASAARHGAEVVLIDSAPDLGGGAHRPLPDEFAAARPHRTRPRRREFADLAEQIRTQPRIRHLAAAQVWGLEDRAVHVQSGPADSPARVDETLRADALVLATGAYDRVLPFPGWELPGVYTLGAARAMACEQRIAVGGRVLVAGSGPSLLPVTEALVETGSEVVGVLEAANTLEWLRDPLALALHWRKIGELIGYLRRLSGCAPYLRRTGVVAVRGRHRVTEAVIAELDAWWRPVPGSERRTPVDAVCVGHGFVPRLELARAAGCVVEDGFVWVDDAQRTSVPWVYAAGEITGVAGVPAAAAEGALAGLAAAVQVRATDWAAVESETRRAALGVRCGRRFGRALAEVHRIGAGWPDWLCRDTLVCRCADVAYGELDDAVRAQGDSDPDALRLTCGVGLGACRGRICAQNVAALAAHLELNERRSTLPG